jgi:hypothetical protein
MSYAYNNLKITFGGVIYGGVDQWSNSFNAGYENKSVNNGTDVFDYQVLVDELAVKIGEWFNDIRTHIDGFAQLDWVKIAVIGTDGLYLEGPWIHDFDTPVYGNSVIYVAPQLSVACTLVTDVKRGAGRFGRIYPPLTGKASSGGADVDTVDRANSFMSLINNLNFVLNEAFPPLIAGPRIIVASKVGAGLNATVTTVKVGQVIDTMRSRRNNIKEVYTIRELD